MKNRQCCDDLANLRYSADDLLQRWTCTLCQRWVTMGPVIEALRVRAVARDAAERNRGHEYDDDVREYE